MYTQARAILLSRAFVFYHPPAQGHSGSTKRRKEVTGTPTLNIRTTLLRNPGKRKNRASTKEAQSLAIFFDSCFLVMRANATLLKTSLALPS